MKCNACGSERLQLIRVFSGHNAMGWSPVSGEKDIFGNYKKLRPLLAHGCTDCGNVNWNIKPMKPSDHVDNIEALNALAREEADYDPAEESTAYSFDLDEQVG